MTKNVFFVTRQNLKVKLIGKDSAVTWSHLKRFGKFMPNTIWSNTRNDTRNSPLSVSNRTAGKMTAENVMVPMAVYF